MAYRNNYIELTGAMPPGLTRGSSRQDSTIAAVKRKPALTLCVNETKRSAREEKSVGDMGRLSDSKENSQNCQSRTLGTFL